MNATAYFGNPHERNFRIKHVSQSPYKQHKNAVSPSMTLYGHNFSVEKKKPSEIPELVTFYGSKKTAYDATPSLKRKDENQGGSKAKRKSQLNLDELLQHENRIKTNFSQKIYLKDMRVEGLKDKLQNRKQRF